MESDASVNPKDNESNEIRLGGNIVLVGFSLEPIEMIVVKKIIGNYAKKIGEKVEYKELKISLKKTEKAQSFLHEISANAEVKDGMLSSNAVNHNLYTALSEALEKVNSQAEHKERTSRQ